MKTSRIFPKYGANDTAAAIRSDLSLDTYVIQVALTGAGVAIATGTKLATARVPYTGTITAVNIDCDPANEPSAAAVQVDVNVVDRSTGTATSVLSAVASIATSANTGSGTVKSDGTEDVTAGDFLSFDIDQGSDGKELTATVVIQYA